MADGNAEPGDETAHAQGARQPDVDFLIAKQRGQEASMAMVVVAYRALRGAPVRAEKFRGHATARHGEQRPGRGIVPELPAETMAERGSPHSSQQRKGRPALRTPG